MKKLFLSVALCATSTLGFAQIQSKAELMQEMSRPVVLENKYKALKTSGSVSQNTPVMKSVANNVYYNRPTGGLYISGQNSQSKVKYSYLTVAPYKEVTFKNMCTDKSSAVWSIGSNTVEGNENNDLVTSFGANLNGYLWYLPSVKVGDISFSLGEEADQNGVYCPSAISSLANCNIALGGNYSGFTSGDYCFGTGNDKFDFDKDGTAEDIICTALYQRFDKPMSPLYIEDIYVPIVSNTTPLAEGKKLYAYIYDVKEVNGRKVLGDNILAKYEATSDNIVANVSGGVTYGGITFANYKEDDFGAKELVPVILDQEFYILISGFDQEGVDVGLRMCNTGSLDYEFNLVDPTFSMYKDTQGKVLGSLYSHGTNSQGVKFSYNAVIYLDAIYDGIVVEDAYDINVQIAPIEGGETAAATFTLNGEEQKDYPAIVSYTMDWFDEDGYETGNYVFEGLEDWIESVNVVENTNTRGKTGTAYVTFTVKKLPDGVTGRYAVVYIKGTHGVNAETPIIVRQGDVDITNGISGVIAGDKSAANTSVYNIMGQRVNSNAKGLVIKNGKKVIINK